MNELEQRASSEQAWSGEDVWIAQGLRKRWRVMTEERTFGEWDSLEQATTFIVLLVAGNTDLRRLA